MSASSREDLKQYCLRHLGQPVIEINVDDWQLEDRIDEAIQEIDKIEATVQSEMELPPMFQIG